MADYVKRANEKMMLALVALKETQSDKAQNTMMAEMASNARFILPVMVTGKTAEDRKMSFGVTSNKEGNHFFMLFTDRDRLRDWSRGKKTETVTYDFSECAALAIGDSRISGFILNPGTDNLLIGRKMIEDLRAQSLGIKNGMTPDAVQTEENVSYKDPDDSARDLIQALRGYLRSDHNVAEAWLREMNRNGQDVYLVVVRHVGSMDPTFTNIMKTAKDYLHGKGLALLSARSSAAPKAIESAEPFYRKPFSVVE